jgi:DNA polymerase III delta prime subunit
METHIENLHGEIKDKLTQFYESKKIPNMIFHGSSGTGKRTIVHWFLNMIYAENKQLMKTNIMLVNCAHGKGIKFIREELKFFAKTNIQSNKGVLFKTIVLLNADFLTIDAQSALRRCIELFSANTRFFIIVENKNKLLNPILSRFCEIYIPELVDPSSENIINLHKTYLDFKYNLQSEYKDKISSIKIIIDKISSLLEISHLDLVKLSSTLYESGYSCLDLMEWVKQCSHSHYSEYEKSEIVICFDKVRMEYRCEKLLMLYMLDFIFLRSNKNLKNIGFI